MAFVRLSLHVDGMVDNHGAETQYTRYTNKQTRHRPRDDHDPRLANGVEDRDVTMARVCGGITKRQRAPWKRQRD